MCIRDRVILAHNHPSGSMKPSTLDDVLTEKVRKVAELMEIHVADHIILSPEKEYYSYHDEGKPVSYTHLDVYKRQP